MHKSVATLDSPEFINLQPLDINPLMSKCEIKVLYIGNNRNRTSISKEVAAEMSKTLRGAPIVGYYKEDKEDFGDHGEKITIDDEGIHFNCQTVPYGFVDPNAKVWFQTYLDYDDDSDESIERTYLCTTGYLWTGQYEECKRVLEQGNPHSMELDEKTMQGDWAIDKNSNIDFFIISDAIFSKLCILGDSVEPCFEGSSITAPNISKTFNLDDNYKNTLFSMMQELKAALEGGQTMADVTNTAVEEEKIETSAENLDNVEQVIEEEINNSTEQSSQETDFVAKKEEEDDKEEEKSDSEEKSDDSEDAKEEDADKNEEEKKKFSYDEDMDAKYSALEEQFNELQTKFSALEAEAVNLREFKAGIEDAQKDEMIANFYMLSDEDKKDVIEHKSEYTLEEIESKLSVICVRNKVSFSLNEESSEEKPVTTFNLNDTTAEILPAWLQAVENNRK